MLFLNNSSSIIFKLDRTLRFQDVAHLQNNLSYPNPKQIVTLMLFPLKVLFTNQDISKIGNCITLVNVSTAVTTLPEFKALAYLIRLEKLYINLHINAGISIKEIEEVFSHLTQLVNLDVIINLLQISVEHLSAFAKAGPKLKKIKVSAHHLNISLAPDKLNAFFDNNKNIEIFVLEINFANNDPLQLLQTFRQEEFPKFKVSKPNPPYLHSSHTRLISFIRA